MNELIKILFLAANPQDVEFRLDLDKEISQIAEKIRSGLRRDCFKLESEWCAKPGVLQEHLRNHSPDILHFSGHGSKSKGLAFEDEAGRTVLVSREAFTRLIKLRKNKIRIAVLNACDTKRQADLLSETIEYTIGMNRPILDEAARVFAAYFYQALAFGDSVSDAFESGLTQLDLEGIKGSNIPELFVRRDADSSKPFLEHPYTERVEPSDGYKNSAPSVPSNQSVSTIGGIYNNAKTVKIESQGGVINKYGAGFTGKNK
jgi:hypothetical protein